MCVYYNLQEILLLTLYTYYYLIYILLRVDWNCDVILYTFKLIIAKILNYSSNN